MFLKKIHYWDCDILSHILLIQSTQFFSLVISIHKIQVDEFFSLAAIVATISEKLSFSYFHGNLYENNAAYQSKLSLKIFSFTDKDSSRKFFIKKLFMLFFPIVMTQTVAIGSKHIKKFFLLIFTNICQKMVHFFKISLMASLNSLRSGSHNFLKEVTKKTRKEAHKKYFVAHQKFLRMTYGTSI